MRVKTRSYINKRERREVMDSFFDQLEDLEDRILFCEENLIDL